MNNKLNNIFLETNCITPDILLAYAEDKLNAEDRHIVEKHLTDCELCSDALEGLSFVKNKSSLPKIFTQINERIDNKIKKKEKNIFYFNFSTTSGKTLKRLAVAAILILAFGITILFRYFIGENKNKMIAQNFNNHPTILKQEKETTEKKVEDKAEKAQTIQEQTKGKNENTILTDAENSNLDEVSGEVTFRTQSANDLSQDDIMHKQPSTGFYRAGEVTTKNSEKANDADKADENSVAIPSVNMSNSITQNNQVMADSTKAMGGNTGTKTTTINQFADNRFEVAKEESQPVQDNKKSAALKKDKAENSKACSTSAYARNINDQRYSDAVQKFSNNDYKGCKELMESFIKDNQNDLNALYYCGASYYFLGEYDNAIMNFDKVLKNKKCDFYENAQWYQALSYIAKKENKKAEKLLNEIVGVNGKYKTQAQGKLLEIK